MLDNKIFNLYKFDNKIFVYKLENKLFNCVKVGQ